MILNGDLLVNFYSQYPLWERSMCKTLTGSVEINIFNFFQKFIDYLQLFFYIRKSNTFWVFEAKNDLLA